MFEINYTKNHFQQRSNPLFGNFKDEELTNFSEIQNYIPLYSKYFNCNSTNWNNINLNQKHSLKSIQSKKSHNLFNVELNNSKKVDAFFKFSPLIDPIKYLAGKYKNVTSEKLFHMPTYENTNLVFPKISNKNNVSYVDGFFSYLSSMLLHKSGFIHGIDFYGSYLGIQQNYIIDIADDFEYLQNYDYFLRKKNVLYTIDFDGAGACADNTRDFKERLRFTEKTCHNITTSTIPVEDFDELFHKQDDNINDVTKTSNIGEFITYENNNLNNSSASISTSSTSSCSSRTSGTDSNQDETSEEDTEQESDEDSDEDSDEEILLELTQLNPEDLRNVINNSTSMSNSSINTYSSMESIEVNVTIDKFPVQVISLEKLENTLDYYMTNSKISTDEWKSIFFQVSVSLYVYQKLFAFTHNDLHTNNIMYYNTDIEYLEYKIENKYYKVPTFGKIYKLIDFGRSIYKYKSNLHCSDSFSQHEDAATQYNFPPFYNKKKPLIEPNMSFDLCRFGCSLFDNFFDSIHDVNNTTDPIALKVAEWCEDDNNKNILYKTNGRERYPGFKLYKMIARTVHNHTPQKEIRDKFYFDFVQKERSDNSPIFMDIDSYEKCYN